MNLFAAVWRRKKYWLMPLIVLALLIGAVLYLRDGGAFLPFIYDRL